MEQVRRVARFLAETEKCRQRYLPVAARGLAWAAALSAVQAAWQQSCCRPGLLPALVAAFAVYETVYRLVLRGVAAPPPSKHFYIGGMAAAAAALVASLVAGGEAAGMVLLAGGVAALSLEVRQYPLAQITSYASATISLLVYYLDGDMEAGLSFIVLSALASAVAAVRRLITCSDEALRTLMLEGM